MDETEQHKLAMMKLGVSDEDRDWEYEGEFGEDLSTARQKIIMKDALRIRTSEPMSVVAEVTGLQESRHGSAVEGLNRGEEVSLSQACVDAAFALEAAASEGGVSAVGLEGAVLEGAA